VSVVKLNRGWFCRRLVLSVIGIVGCGDNVGRRLVLSAAGSGGGWLCCRLVLSVAGIVGR
jgi:hypothetical protein